MFSAGFGSKHKVTDTVLQAKPAQRICFFAALIHQKTDKGTQHCFEKPSAIRNNAARAREAHCAKGLQNHTFYLLLFPFSLFVEFRIREPSPGPGTELFCFRFVGVSQLVADVF